jgi:hypothetical protein
MRADQTAVAAMFAPHSAGIVTELHRRHLTKPFFAYRSSAANTKDRSRVPALARVEAGRTSLHH